VLRFYLVLITMFKKRKRSLKLVVMCSMQKKQFCHLRVYRMCIGMSVLGLGHLFL